MAQTTPTMKQRSGSAKVIRIRSLFTSTPFKGKNRNQRRRMAQAFRAMKPRKFQPKLLPGGWL